MLQKPELLAPAGDMEKLKMAVLYGADAVYLGGEFSLRARSGNFSPDELAEAVDWAHRHGVRVYLTANIYANEGQLSGLREWLMRAAETGVDAFIISDPGVFALAGECAPNVARHISTQASCTNSSAVRFWRQQGAERVILAREVTLAECGEIAGKTDAELEIFVHGAMCVSYSGRCLLSSFMTQRSGNQGDCAQPCRWEYRLEEAKRPGAYMPIEEDGRGTYIMNSKDLCLVELLPEILQAGVSSLKIEGRMKSAYYVANVTRIYRQALDECWRAWSLTGGSSVEACRSEYHYDPEWLEELRRVSHRQYFTGFALGQPNAGGFVYDSSYSCRGYDFAGVVLDYDAENQRIKIEQRNHLALGDDVEIITPHNGVKYLRLTGIWSEDGDAREKLPHPREIAWLHCKERLAPGSILRRPSRENRL